jgi:hypothetical protein
MLAVIDIDTVMAADEMVPVAVKVPVLKLLLCMCKRPDKCCWYMLLLLLLFAADVTLVLCEREEVTHRSTPFLVAWTSTSTGNGTAFRLCVTLAWEPLTCPSCCTTNHKRRLKHSK